MTDMKVVGIETKQKEETYLDRLEKEYADLVDKMEKLVLFLDSEKKAKLSANDLFLLVRQFKAMADYALILESRLGILDEEEY